MILSFKLGLICSISMRHSEDGFDIHPVLLEKLIWSNSRNIHRTSHIFQLSLDDCVIRIAIFDKITK